MTDNRNISSLFDQSGNLTLSAMERYLKSLLSDHEKSSVEAHLEASPFDREAVEGLKKHLSIDIRAEVEEIDTKILTAAREKPQLPQKSFIRRFYWAAAAGLVVLVGLTVLLVFTFRPFTSRQSLVVSHQSQVDSGQLAVAPDPSVSSQQQALEVNTEGSAASSLEPETENQEPETRNQEPGTIGGIAMTDQILPEEDRQPSVTDVPAAVATPAPEPVQPVYQVEIAVVAEQGADISRDEMIESERESYGETAKRTGTSRKEAISGYNVQEVKAMDYPGEDTVTGEESIFITVETMPEFPGGEEAIIQYFDTTLTYPQMAKENRIQGRIFVTFIIEKDGSVSNVKLLRGIGGGCDEEAIRVIQSMPKWIPGKQRGQAVRVQYNLPVKFTLEEK